MAAIEFRYERINTHMELASTVSVLVNSDNVSVPLRAVRNIPALNDLYVADKPLVIPGEMFNETQFQALAKIMTGGTLIPFADLSSHLDVLRVFELASALSVSKRHVVDGFISWASHYKWHNLSDYEYMYLLHIQCADLVNFAKFFAIGAKNVALMPAIANKTRELASLEYIPCLALFQRLIFLDGFESTGKQTNEKVKLLERARADIHDMFIINPWEHGEYFTFEPKLGDNIWRCDGISIYKKLAFGDAVIVSKAEFDERFAKFTRGLITKSPSGVAGEFPADVVFAGGSITKLLCTEYNEKIARSSDLDMFVIGKNNTEKS